jgi:hypothetical protein
MSLPACQERILHGMETALRTHEPRLAAIFAIFARLTKDEDIPHIERLAPQPWLSWRRLPRAARGGRGPSQQQRGGRLARTPRVLVVVLLTWLVFFSVCITVGFSDGSSCGQPPARMAAASQARALVSATSWTGMREGRCRQGR